MGLGVSNLMWPATADDRIAGVLAAHGIDRIDIAPSRYFDPLAPVAPQAIDRVRRAWADRGMRIVGLQALLHGSERGAVVPALFGDDAARAALVARLHECIGLAAGLGATVLVLGSWQRRLRGTLALDAAIDQAAAVLAPVARHAADVGACVAVEPISGSYGNDFLVDHDQAADLVAAIDHPGFALTLDVGCAGLVGEDLRQVLARHGALVRHVQLAEPGLAPLADADWHRVAGPVLAAWLDERAATGASVPGVCIEALTPDGSDPAAAVGQSIAIARRWYS